MASTSNDLLKDFNVNNIWDKLDAKYLENQQLYLTKWSSRYKLMIILFFCLLFPGVFYYAFVWKPGRVERETMATRFLKEVLEDVINNSEDIPIKNFELSFQDDWDTVFSPLPLNKNRMSKPFNPLAGFGMGGKRVGAAPGGLVGMQGANPAVSLDGNPTISRGASIPGNKMFNNKTNEVTQRLFQTHVVSEIGIESSHMRVLESLASVNSMSYTINLNLKTSTCGSVVFAIDDVHVKIYNLTATILRTKVIDNKTEVIVTNTFTGIVAFLDAKIDYPNDLLLRTKQWHGEHNESLIHHEWHSLEYKLASNEFNDTFNILVEQEDGVALRKAFQPRQMAKLIDIAKASTPFVLTYINGGLALLARAVDNQDVPLRIEDTQKFFSGSEVAKKMIEKDLRPIFEVTKFISELKKNDFLKLAT